MLLVLYLNRLNTEDSYIALRLFVQAMPGIYTWKWANFLNQVLMLHEKTPELIEWEEVDKIFEQWFQAVYERSNRTFVKDPSLLQSLIK